MLTGKETDIMGGHIPLKMISSELLVLTMSARLMLFCSVQLKRTSSIKTVLHKYLYLLFNGVAVKL